MRNSDQQVLCTYAEDEMCGSHAHTHTDICPCVCVYVYVYIYMSKGKFVSVLNYHTTPIA